MNCSNYHKTNILKPLKNVDKRKKLGQQNV